MFIIFAEYYFKTGLIGFYYCKGIEIIIISMCDLRIFDIILKLYEKRK